MGQIVSTVAADLYAKAKQTTKKVKTVYQDLEPVNVGMQSESNSSFGHEYFQKVPKCVATTVLVKVLYLVCISQLLQR